MPKVVSKKPPMPPSPVAELCNLLRVAYSPVLEVDGMLAALRHAVEWRRQLPVGSLSEGEHFSVPSLRLTGTVQHQSDGETRVRIEREGGKTDSAHWSTATKVLPVAKAPPPPPVPMTKPTPVKLSAPSPRQEPSIFD